MSQLFTMKCDALRTCALLLAGALTACATSKAPITEPEPLTLYLLGDGRCEVRSWELACADVQTYLHDVLKVTRGTPVSLEFRGTRSYEGMADMMEDLGKAGFKLGYVHTSESENQRP
jgi:biopolymer transport protein ExbD